MKIYPEKLHPGDELRVVSPARSLAMISPPVRRLAEERLAALGFHLTYGKNTALIDEFASSPAPARLEDLHAAFADPQVKGILTTLGGYNSNTLLAGLDYALLRRNPKVLCGYSDITALASAIYARSGLVTYSGPHFSTFGMRDGLDYTLEYFRKCLLADEPFEVLPSPQWSDDPWYRDQEQRAFLDNPGYVVLHPGQAEGELLGGNLCTLNLLQGTPYMPELAGSLLLVEDDAESQPVNFERDLQSLLHQPGFEQVQGLVIGRFQHASHMSLEKLWAIIDSKPELHRMPVVAQADFGHTSPQFTFPIGGRARLSASPSAVRLEILEH